MSIKDDPVDVVYLWCDGNDPAFRERKEKRLNEFGLNSLKPESEETIGEMRYVDNDELKYSLRSLHQSIPWVNHIWIITDNQRPSWLKENNRLSIVDHTEVLPSDILPCFNSITIETYGIINLDGLAEKFIYCNDDMFFLGKLDKDDFFDEGGNPISRMHRDLHITSEGKSSEDMRSPEEIDEAIALNKEWSFRNTTLRAWKASCLANGWHDFYELNHVPDAMTRSILRHVCEKYPDFLQCNTSPFRTDKEIQRVLIQYEMVFGLRYKLSESHKTRAKKYFSLIFPFLGNRNDHFTDTLAAIESPQYFRKILKWRPKMFCINASPGNDPLLKKQTCDFLEELFPEKSPYEI
ncbi:MAG: Stealth CR1 domain-containing protein [Oxalobacter formigenes]|nr:Stealth CR1 domain-containing protein [Oxalobacter formigenes]